MRSAVQGVVRCRAGERERVREREILPVYVSVCVGATVCVGVAVCVLRCMGQGIDRVECVCVFVWVG